MNRHNRKQAPKIIALFHEGNTWGVVEEPAQIDPAVPTDQQQMVKIGAIDGRAPCSAGEIELVIGGLRELLTEGKSIANKEIANKEPLMDTERLQFAVEVNGDRALIAMNCGHGVTRARTMPIEVLHMVGKLCGRLRDEGAQVLASGDVEMPSYPKVRALVSGGLPGICHGRFSVCRLLDGTLERMVAIYDDGDDEAPTLVLIDEQINVFIRQASP